MLNHYKIDEMITPYGKFELWEHKYFGEDEPATVTLNSIDVGCTYNPLHIFIRDEFDPDDFNLD